jgi:hypothetical protein
VPKQSSRIRPRPSGLNGLNHSWCCHSSVHVRRSAGARQMRSPRNQNVTGASQIEWRRASHAAIALAARSTNPSFERQVHSETCLFALWKHRPTVDNRVSWAAAHPFSQTGVGEWQLSPPSNESSRPQPRPERATVCKVLRLLTPTKEPHISRRPPLALRIDDSDV